MEYGQSSQIKYFVMDVIDRIYCVTRRYKNLQIVRADENRKVLDRKN